MMSLTLRYSMHKIRARPSAICFNLTDTGLRSCLLNKYHFSQHTCQIDNDIIDLDSSNKKKIDIMEYFSERPKSQQKIDLIIKDCLLLECDSNEIVNLSQLTGKESQNQNDPLIRNYFPIIFRRLKELPSSSCNFKSISQIIHGMQYCTEKKKGILDILSLLSNTKFEQQDIPKAEDISILFLGFQNFIQVDNSRTRKFLEILPSMIFKCKEDFSARQVADCIYGLQGMSSEYFEVRNILSALEPKLKQCVGVLTASDVGIIICGLRGMKITSFELITFLTVLIPKVKKCQGEFTAEDIQNILSGLQELRSESTEVRDLLSALTPIIKKSNVGILTARNLAKSMYGLQGMNSEYTEVCNFLSVIIPKIQSCNETFHSASDISDVFYGLREMNSDHAEVRDILSALEPIINKSVVSNITPRTVGRSLFGLQGMNSDCVEVRNILSVLIPKIQTCNQYFEPIDVSTALYGLQSMNCESTEVCNLLSVLSTKTKNCNKLFTTRMIGVSLCGLQGVCNRRESLPLVRQIHDQIIRLFEATEEFDLLRTKDLVALRHHLVGNLNELKQFDHEKWDKIDRLSSNELTIRRERNDLFFHDLNLPSIAERRLTNITMKAFQGTSISITQNEFLFNIFESDIVLRIPIIMSNNKTGKILINIEIDGNHHKKSKSKNFTRQRDKYLSSKGIVIERIDSSFFCKISDKEIEERLLKTVDDVLAEFHSHR